MRVEVWNCTDTCLIFEESWMTLVCLNRFLWWRALAISSREIGGLLLSINSSYILWMLAVHVDLPLITVVQGLYDESWFKLPLLSTVGWSTVMLDIIDSYRPADNWLTACCCINPHCRASQLNRLNGWTPWLPAGITAILPTRWWGSLFQNK